MIREGTRTAILGSLLQALVCFAPPPLEAQFGVREALGDLYRVSAPPTAARTFDRVEIERVAPHALTMPAPFEPLPLGTSLQALTGLVREVSERQRIFFTGIDARGVVRLFEIDLISRQLREVEPGFGAAPLAVEFLVTRQASKLYVRWYRAAGTRQTDIYDGATLNWLDRTFEFGPDARAAGFQHVEPYLWTLDEAGRPLLIDTNSDRVVRRFDAERWFGPVRSVTEDAWRDLLLMRTDVGHDRFQVVDVVSGEVGPALDLVGYAQAEARLELGGRVLVLLEFERRARWRGRHYPIAIATGAGSLYDLSTGVRTGDFRLIVPFELPVPALGTSTDPTVPGRLWVHAPNDDQRFDFDLAACDRSAPQGDDLQAELDVYRDPDEPRAYHYRLRVLEDAQSQAGALAIQAARATDRSGKPDGWGVDLIARDRWIRWTNALGPAKENVAPGASLDGFVLYAEADTRPGIAEYRTQAAIGLPRGCESDDRFLRNSLRGFTVAPERIDGRRPAELARRLSDLVDRACEIGWADEAACELLRDAAHGIGDEGADLEAVVDHFLAIVGDTDLVAAGEIVLTDAARAVAEARAGSGGR